MVPASFDFCLANLNREASSAGTSIPSESLNPTARFVGAVDGVHHVDREAALVEDVGHSDVLDLEGRSLERARRDDDVAFLLEDPVHPVDGRLGLARRLDREVVVVLVLEVAGLVGPQTSERGRDRRRLQTDGRDVAEIHGVGHDALPSSPQNVRLPGRTLLAGARAAAGSAMG